MIGPVTNSFSPSFVHNSRPKSYCDRIKTIPVIGHIIRAIIWLFQKIFPCCRSSEIPRHEQINHSQKYLDLVTLLALRSPIRGMILGDLYDNDLQALEIALSKRVQKPEFREFHKEVTQIQQKRLLQEILVDNPSWKNQVEDWKGISLDDKIWLLQLYELRNLGVEIPQIVKQGSSACIPSQSTPDLLQPVTKAAITKDLNEFTYFNYSNSGLKKCPRAIGLLRNLKELYLERNELTIPPDVTKNVNLHWLHLQHNPLKAPPNVTKNVNLEHLFLDSTQLTTSPDVSKNVNLQRLYLHDSQLTTPPDVSKNVNLQWLLLSDNKLTAPPDVSKNVNLEVLNLQKNPLTLHAEQALEKLEKKRTNLVIHYN